MNLKWLKLAGIASVFLWLQGCTALDYLGCAPDCHAQAHRSSSLVNYLYPDGKAPPVDNAIPQLPVPLSVGLAFVPATQDAGDTLDPVEKDQLLDKIRQRFASRPFVSQITIIPDYYLSQSRGVAGLEAIQRLYGVDVVALVSYDQAMHSDDNAASLGYLTIVGAYVLRGTDNEVSTLVDLAVVDPKTHSLVLRAGGVDARAKSTTLFDLNRNVRRNGAESFDAAAQQMMEHFDTALTKFEEDVRNGKSRVQVVSRSGSGGAGAISIWGMLVLAMLCAARGLYASRPMQGIIRSGQNQ